MIGRLTGAIVHDSVDGLILDVRGVGYELSVPLGTGGRLNPSAQGEVCLFVHTHVREDVLSLFGFATLEDRETFRTLVNLSGVGPKLALAVLGSLSVNDLAATVARGEISRLVSIPGVGKKTAERLLLELKGKLIAKTSSLRRESPTLPTGPADVVLGALTRMGWKPAEAERAVAQVVESHAAADRAVTSVPISDLVREALAILSK